MLDFFSLECAEGEKKACLVYGLLIEVLETSSFCKYKHHITNDFNAQISYFALKINPDTNSPQRDKKDPSCNWTTSLGGNSSYLKENVFLLKTTNKQTK